MLPEHFVLIPILAPNPCILIIVSLPVFIISPSSLYKKKKKETRVEGKDNEFEYIESEVFRW